jgi:hypothetical protein
MYGMLARIYEKQHDDSTVKGVCLNQRCSLQLRRAQCSQSRSKALCILCCQEQRSCVCKTLKLLGLGILKKISLEISMGFKLVAIYAFLFLSNGVCLVLYHS